MRPDELRIESLRPRHLPSFFSLAAKEGWLCEEWEFDFLLRSFPQGCRTALSHGTAAGFVTSVRYETSGWIGNLLVREGLRGRGLGRMLMEQALASLECAGTRTVWLTASPSGQPLYEKMGFVPADRIIRWGGTGGGGQEMGARPYCLEAIEETDKLGWGDGRSRILREVAERGTVLGAEDGFCMLQGGAGGWQLGPWGCLRPEAAEPLLQMALAAAGAHPGGIVLDVPEGNREAARILRTHSFVERGVTVLMYMGERPRYQPRHIYALASMGSMG